MDYSSSGSSDGPSGDHTSGTGYYAVVTLSDSSSHDYGLYQDSVNTYVYQIKFYYWMYSNSERDIGTLKVQYYNGTNWVTSWSEYVQSYSGTQAWTSATASIDAVADSVKIVLTSAACSSSSSSYYLSLIHI